MQDLLNSESSDEIDLREMFLSLWAYKLFIACTCVLGIVFGIYYFLNTDKKFTSTAIFKLSFTDNSTSPLAGDIGLLANMAGIQSGFNEKKLPIDQITGRIFIEQIDQTLNLQSDPFFNTYNPNSVDPNWKSLIKRTIGLQSSSFDAQEAMWQVIVAGYFKNVELEETPTGTIKVTVTHVIPQRAAEIANSIMHTIIANEKIKRDKQQEKQLSFLSGTLAKSLIDLEVSQSNLKEFALKNSALPLENFTAGSLELDLLREQLNRTSELQEAVGALSLILQNKTISQNDYLTLRQQIPIIDQVEFRRVLGQNEIINSWTWPKASSVSAVFDTLTERKSRLVSQINVSQANAERSALALETYGKLAREEKIAEATYTVLIEQVKAQSMAAGYKPDNTEIYEYASVPTSSSSPNQKRVLAFGGMLGLSFGLLLSLLFARIRGVYYSKKSLKIGAQARFTASARALLTLRNKSLNEIKTILVKKPYSVLRDIVLEIHKSDEKQVVVTSSHAKLTGNDVARALASYMQSDKIKIAIIDFSLKTKKQNINDEQLSFGSFVVTESSGQISALRSHSNLPTIDFLINKDFWQNIQALNSTFDLVFLCADNADAISLLTAAEGQKTFHITLARTKKTKSTSLIQMRSLLPIQGLIYD